MKEKKPPLHFKDRMFPIQTIMHDNYIGDQDSLSGHIYDLVTRLSKQREFSALHGDEEIPAEWMSLSPMEKTLMEFLIVVSRAETVLEIGTFTGVSTMHLASALPRHGSVVTIEKFDRFAAIARRNFEDNGLSEKIELLCGDALSILLTLSKRKFDFVFLDGDKEHYLDYFNCIDTELLAPEGIIVVDDVFFQGDVFNPQPQTAKGEGAKRLIDAVENRNDYMRLMLPIDNGMLVMTRRRNK